MPTVVMESEPCKIEVFEFSLVHDTMRNLELTLILTQGHRVTIYYTHHRL